MRVLNMPFREAHHVTGRIVGIASTKGVDLEKLSLGEMQSVEPRITGAIFDVLGVTNSVKSRTSYGGTAPANVRMQAKRWLAVLPRKQSEEVAGQTREVRQGAGMTCPAPHVRQAQL